MLMFFIFPQTLLTSETARIKDENGKTVLLLAAETGIITNSHYVVYIYCVDYWFSKKNYQAAMEKKLHVHNVLYSVSRILEDTYQGEFEFLQFMIIYKNLLFSGSLLACKIILEIAGRQRVIDRDNNDRSALHLASINGHGDVINHLLDYGGILIWRTFSENEIYFNLTNIHISMYNIFGLLIYKSILKWSLLSDIT